MTDLYALAPLWRKINPKTNYSVCLLAAKAILQEVSTTILDVVANFGLPLSAAFAQERDVALEQLFPWGNSYNGRCIHRLGRNHMHTTPNLLASNNALILCQKLIFRSFYLSVIFKGIGFKIR